MLMTVVTAALLGQAVPQEARHNSLLDLSAEIRSLSARVAPAVAGRLPSPEQPKHLTKRILLAKPIPPQELEA